MAQTEAQTCSWKQGPHTTNGTVKAIGEGTLHAIRWLLFKGRLLKHAVGLGEGGRTLCVAVAQVPEHPAADDRGQIHLGGETTAVLFIGQDVCRQPQATAGQHRDETVLTEGTDDAIEGHGRDMADRRAPFQTETAVGGQQGVPSHVGAHRGGSAGRNGAAR